MLYSYKVYFLYTKYIYIYNSFQFYKKGGINTDRLIEFLENNIISKLRNKLIILDNASAHRNERIKQEK